MDTSLFYGYEFLASFIPFFIALMTIIHSQKKKGIYLARTSYVLLFLFIIYIIGVYHFTCAGTLYEGLRYRFRLRNNLNLLPFSEEIDMTGYFLNILLFIPLGIIVPLIWDRMNRFLCISAVGLGFSLFIEMSQFLNIRATDVDDLIMNTLGTIIGFGLYKLFDLCTKSRFQQKEIPVKILVSSILISYVGRFLFYNEMGLARLLYNF